MRTGSKHTPHKSHKFHKMLFIIKICNYDVYAYRGRDGPRQTERLVKVEKAFI